MAKKVNLLSKNIHILALISFLLGMSLFGLQIIFFAKIVHKPFFIDLNIFK